MNCPVAILAGGKGTRLSEETLVKPKPLVEVGGRPILWHIMKLYAYYGFCDFVLALGYRGEMIREYFERCPNPTWNVRMLDTGIETQTAGRVRQVLEFTAVRTLLTYGDGVANINLPDLVRFHRFQGAMATITAVRPPSRFGRVRLAPDGVTVLDFDEKPLDGEYINGGFMVVEPDVLELGKLTDEENFEKVYLPRMARIRQLSAYVHTDFWQCMDTLRDKELLNQLWDAGDAKWRVWAD